MLVKFLIRNSKLLSAIAALIAICIFCFGLAKYFLRPPDLEVAITLSEANLPISIAAKYANSYNALSSYSTSNKINPSILDDSHDVLTFLNKTAYKAKYEITNNSNYSLKNIDIRIRNITHLTAYGISGNILQSIELSSIMKSMKEDQESGIITFSNIEKFPPKSTLAISIWGEIRQYIFDEPINVTYDGGSAKIIKTATVKGVVAFLCENIPFLFLLLVILNIGFMLLIINKYVPNPNKTTNNDNKNSSV